MKSISFETDMSSVMRLTDKIESKEKFDDHLENKEY